MVYHLFSGYSEGCFGILGMVLVRMVLVFPEILVVLVGIKWNSVVTPVVMLFGIATGPLQRVVIGVVVVVEMIVPLGAWVGVVLVA